MRRLEKNLSFDDQNQQFKQTSRAGPKHLKFQRIRKQSATLPLHYNINPCQNTNRKYIYDQEAMNDIILALKEQNNELKNLIKIQQTQINYFQQQERNLITSTVNKGNITAKSQSTPALGGQLKKLQLQNFRLKKQVQKLEEQNGKIKKTVKQTSIKQLQTQIYVYEQEIKNLTAKLTGFKKSNTNISEINKIIQKEYHSGLKIKELQSTIDNKSIQLEQSGKVIRKLKNIIHQKNTQIESFKEERQKIQNIITKNKANEEYVPKSELITKKKQLLAMTETIQKLQSKLIECQSKAQALQQENIDNMNRQTNKRKEILVQFQKLKKNHQHLQQALAMSLKKNNDVLTPLRLTKVPDQDNSFGKQRVSHVVKIQQIKEPTQIIIHNLQKNNIDHKSALNLLNNSNPNTQRVSNSQKLDENEQKINIRQIIHCLEQYPISLQNYQHKELVARYLVQSESESTETINYDSFVNISFARSVFKLLLQQYPLFSEDEISSICFIVQDFLKRNEHTIKATLYKVQQQKSDHYFKKNDQNQIENSTMNLNGSCKLNNKKKGAHKCQDYIEAMFRQNQLNDEAMKFIKYWTFSQRDQYLTYPELIDYFKVEGVCTFITQDPDNYLCAEQKNEKSIEKENNNKSEDTQMNNIS